MKYKAVAFDMDGTLLGSNRLILPETITAIQKVREKGVKVILVSGRHHSVMYPYYYELKLTTPAICCNGTYLYDFKKQQIFSDNPMTKAQAKKLLSLINEYGVHTLLYIDKDMTYEVLDDHLAGLFEWIATLPEFLKPEIKKVDSFESTIDNAAQVLKFATSSHDIPALHKFVAAVTAENNFSCEWSWSNRVDVSAKGNTKGNGLTHWAAHEQIDLSEIVAFGDSYNDISMLTIAGLGIAMGNADDEVKAHANYSIGDNNSPSIATELEKIIFIDKSKPDNMFDILYRDDALIAIDKPSGWLVHRSWLDKNATVFVMQTLRNQIGQHVFPVHRLDRPTSGVLLFALSSDVARLLSEQFSLQKTSKTYYAIVRGYVDNQAIIDYPLIEELDKIADKYANQNKPAQEAVTHYRGISKVEVPIKIGKFDTARYSLVELKPQTGRKHQLRRHMKHIFHPIIGDSKHGDLHQNRAFADYFGIKRLMLHATMLSLTHPITQNLINITSNIPQEWQNLLETFTNFDDSN